MLKTLSRILILSNDNKLTEQYNLAKALLDHLSTTLELQYGDIALLTTGAAELELFPELKELNSRHSAESYTGKVEGSHQIKDKNYWKFPFLTLIPHHFHSFYIYSTLMASLR